MKLIKIKAILPNRYKLVDAAGFKIGVIEITQIGLEAKIKIVEKGAFYEGLTIATGGV